MQSTQPPVPPSRGASIKRLRKGWANYTRPARVRRTLAEAPIGIILLAYISLPLPGLAPGPTRVPLELAPNQLSLLQPWRPEIQAAGRAETQLDQPEGKTSSSWLFSSGIEKTGSPSPPGCH